MGSCLLRINNYEFVKNVLNFQISLLLEKKIPGYTVRQAQYSAHPKLKQMGDKIPKTGLIQYYCILSKKNFK